MDFNALAGKAGELIREHGDQIEDAAERVGEIVKDKFGHAEQVDQVVGKIKDLIPDGEGSASGPSAGQ